MYDDTFVYLSWSRDDIEQARQEAWEQIQNEMREEYYKEMMEAMWGE